RKFRAEQDQVFSSCKQACEIFLEYLKNLPRYDKNEDDHLRFILLEEMKEIGKKYRSRYVGHVIEKQKEAKDKDLDYGAALEELLTLIINDFKATHDKKPLEGFCDDVNIEKFKDRYGDLVTSGFKYLNKEVYFSEPIADALISWAFSVMKSGI